ncbi:MAG TPA: CdaR family protein [Geobacteraceae bacterium]
MNRPDWLVKNLHLKLLSLAAAAVLWLTVTYGKETTAVFRVPIEPSRLSPGLAVAGQLPSSAEVTVVGPKYRLLMLDRGLPAVRLDLAGVGTGLTAFPDLAGVVKVPPGVRIERIYPAAVTVQIVRR